MKKKIFLSLAILINFLIEIQKLNKNLSEMKIKRIKIIIIIIIIMKIMPNQNNKMKNKVMIIKKMVIKLNLIISFY